MRGLLALLLVGCGVNPYDRNDYSNVAPYAVVFSTRTPAGIAVDDSGQHLDLAEVDARVDAVEACLARKFPDGRLPPDIVKASSCLYNAFDVHVHRDVLGVKLAPDWHRTPPGCGDDAMEIFPCAVDPRLCVAKGLVITDACPCECRSAVLDNDIVVTTPDMHLFDDSLIRILTSCNNIWTSTLAECWRG